MQSPEHYWLQEVHGNIKLEMVGGEHGIRKEEACHEKDSVRRM